MIDGLEEKKRESGGNLASHYERKMFPTLKGCFQHLGNLISTPTHFLGKCLTSI